MLQELGKMVIELMLDFHAWSTSRPTRESDLTADFLEKEVNDIMGIEKEQGRSSTSSVSCSHIMGRPMFHHHPYAMAPSFDICGADALSLEEKTRQRLNDFVSRIKIALAALTGI